MATQTNSIPFDQRIPAATLAVTSGALAGIAGAYAAGTKVWNSYTGYDDAKDAREAYVGIQRLMDPQTFVGEKSTKRDCKIEIFSRNCVEK